MAIAEDTLNTGLCIQARATAFDAFVGTHRDRAVRLAFRLLRGDAAAAEDVTQNAFLRAHRGLANFRQEASLDTWFYRILVREAQRHRRWQAVRWMWSAEMTEAREPVDEHPSGDPGLRRRIATALERLTAAQREAFVLVHLEGFSISEAAAILGKAPGTMKSHLHRALESLRSELADLRTAKEQKNSTGVKP
jgi:RNA polymerase sigma-70 factor (ECF subfamily)